MKRIWYILQPYYPWLLALLGTDCLSACVLWLADVRAFHALIGFIILAGILLSASVLFLVYRQDQIRRELFRSFLSNPDACIEKQLLALMSHEEGKNIRLLASVLRAYKTEAGRMESALQDYEEYVESWAHEAKTPLSLLTMLLDNRSNEISPSLKIKLDYVRNQFQEDITQMLYYARLKSSTKDYRFEEIDLKDCLEDVLEDYAPLLEEKQFLILNQLQTETVYTDRRGLTFMLSQIISNAIKYSSRHPVLTISIEQSDSCAVLSIEDNGSGVKEHDLPYIFQKSFTGDSADRRKKATGMGLYLTKKMSDSLNLHLEAASRWGEGFKISILFPK